MTDPAMTDPTPPQVPPLDEDGVAAVRVGIVGWLIALGVLLLLRDRLAAADATWWLWVAVTGAALGLPGLWFTTRRRAAYRGPGKEQA